MVTRSRVTPGMSCTMLIRLPTSALSSEDFPTLGRPTIAITGMRDAMSPILRSQRLISEPAQPIWRWALSLSQASAGGLLVTRVDHNGKVFTDQVRKQKIASIVQPSTSGIRGILFHDYEGRLKDNLNDRSEDFIAVADAEFLSPDGKVIGRTE